VHPITALQSEYSLWERSVEEEILPTVRELGLGFVAYSPLGRGFLTGKIRSVDDLEESDARRVRFPRFERENLEANLAVVEQVEAVAERHGASAGQVALAWVLSRGDDVIAIPGTKRVERVEENLGALELDLTGEDLAQLDALADAVSGGRYAPEGMQSVGR
jgi:aryl-alcohol dehydrogenase-like predicted oxidoreductase